MLMPCTRSSCASPVETVSPVDGVPVEPTPVAAASASHGRCRSPAARPPRSSRRHRLRFLRGVGIGLRLLRRRRPSSARRPSSPADRLLRAVEPRHARFDLRALRRIRNLVEILLVVADRVLGVAELVVAEREVVVVEIRGREILRRRELLDRGFVVRRRVRLLSRLVVRARVTASISPRERNARA